MTHVLENKYPEQMTEQCSLVVESGCKATATKSPVPITEHYRFCKTWALRVKSTLHREYTQIVAVPTESPLQIRIYCRVAS